jgi:hypothetical protein
MDNRADLTEIESFCFFCKSLWSPEITRKFHALIPDTLVYFRGRPHVWYFSSLKTGVSLFPPLF